MEALQTTPTSRPSATGSSSSYALAQTGEAVVICLDEFGPLNLQPQPGGRGWCAARQAQAHPRDLQAPAQFRALRYFALAGTDHPDHATQARLIGRYIAWRNRNTDNAHLRTIVNHGKRCLTLH
jgi:hypothetical protein